ncbi:MAG: formylglycine-generating enzyme family protein [Chloroflexota bacterium]
MPELPAILVCHVPGGEYHIGHNALQASRPAHTVTLAPFYIAAETVTNALFAGFVVDGGYRERAYWTDIGWRWLESKAVEIPAFWHEAAFNHPLQPVVGIGWYEGLAFCNWLAHRTGIAWRLPTEAEWEAAARDPQQPETYLQPERVNSAERQLGRPWAAIGIGQQTWCGAHEMAGNVWEWTASRWGRNWQTLEYPYPYKPDDGREDLSGSFARVMRGGSWFDPATAAFPFHRARYLPGSRGSNIGVRLAHS